MTWIRTDVATYSGTSGPVQSFPAVTSGMVLSALSGMRSGGEPIPAVFQYGGGEVDGSYSRGLWVGFPDLGLEVIDSKGVTVGRDLAPVTDNYVAFHGHSVYGIRVVPGPGFDPSVRPRYTLEVSYGDLSHVTDVSVTQGVNELMIHEGHAYLMGTEGMHAVSLADPVSPDVAGLLDLQGYGHDVAMCGRKACVAKTRRSESLKVVDISDPGNLKRWEGFIHPARARQ